MLRDGNQKYNLFHHTDLPSCTLDMHAYLNQLSINNKQQARVVEIRFHNAKNYPLAPQSTTFFEVTHRRCHGSESPSVSDLKRGRNVGICKPTEAGIHSLHQSSYHRFVQRLAEAEFEKAVRSGIKRREPIARNSAASRL